MTRNRVLVVEDNPDDEELTRRGVLQVDAEAEIAVARDGAEALDFFFGPAGVAGKDVESQPNLVLLDLRMPRIDGLEVLRRLRTDRRTRLVPVVMLSSSTAEEEIERAYGLGVNSWVRKPADFGGFADAVREVGRYWLLLNARPPRPRGL